MQNKGFVRLIAIALILVSGFYLSFSFITNHYESKAEEYANGNNAKYYTYLDSISSQKVWLGYTLKECREKEINLGLDLKGGMNVILEVSVPDLVKSLSDQNKSPNFNKAVEVAAQRQAHSQADYLTLFEQAYLEIDPNVRLSTIFSTFELKDKISLNSTNEQVMKVLRSEIDGSVSNSFNILRTRIDRFGVVQPNIQRLGNTGRILVELPGVKEPKRVRKLLQGTANLEFWETYELSEITQNLESVNKLLASINKATKDSTAKDPSTAAASSKNAKQSAIDSLAAAMGGGKKAGAAAANNKDAKQEKAKLEKENPLFSILQLNVQNGQVAPGAIVGVAHYTDTTKINRYFNLPQVKAALPHDLCFKWGVKALDEKEQYYQLYAIKVTNRDGKAPLQGDVVTDASTDFGQHSAYATVEMQMNTDGANIWSRLTEDNKGRCIAIVLDGYVYSAPRVNDKISGGRSEITGNFTVEEAKDLANVLKSGRMPAPVHIVQEDVVGPSLGQESIQSGFISFAIAFVLILLYMILYYGLIPGLVADTALFINVFLMMGILASFKSVLTLPGIAGIVLTLGVAVDTNVLIYERIREELKEGKNMRTAISEGYSRAFTAIIDTHITTLISGIILFTFGTGPIKGFATTLIIGIIASFMTGFILSRLIHEKISEREQASGQTFYTKFSRNWLQKNNLNIIGKRKYGYIISGTIILVSLISLFTPGQGLNEGIDFSGGRNYVVRFDKPVETQDVKSMLEGDFGKQSISVITIGSANQVRISTNYKINSSASTVDAEIEGKLYKSLKPLLKKNTTMEEFVKTNIRSSQKVGPTVANDIRTSAVWALLISIIGIGLYIFIRYRDIAFALGGIASLAHDALVVIGVYSLLYKIMPFSLEIDQTFIAAILTVIGYSINDTVVIFDRVREYRKLYPKRETLHLLNDSINSTLSRTFSTTFTIFIVLLVIFLFGGETIRGFVFAMLVGTVTGVYSTLFIAVPTAYEVMKKEKRTTKGDEDDYVSKKK
jgi:SecD/SecF fusion protein